MLQILLLKKCKYTQNIAWDIFLSKKAFVIYLKLKFNWVS